jgi:hypothetical protein
MNRSHSIFTLALFLSVAPVRAEFLQMDLSIFGMD